MPTIRRAGCFFEPQRGFVLLDRKYLRENQELVIRAVALKNESVDIGAYYEKDAERRAALQEMESLQAEANKANKAISEKKKAGEDASEAILAMKQVSGKVKELKSRAAELEAEVETLYMRIPNVPHPSAPEGGEENNETVRTWGEPVDPDFEVLPHWEIGSDLGIFHSERASRMSGSGFSVLTGAGARLERALINWFLDVHLEQGYTECNVPYMCNRTAMTGTGQLPKLEDDMYLILVVLFSQGKDLKDDGIGRAVDLLFQQDLIIGQRDADDLGVPQQRSARGVSHDEGHLVFVDYLDDGLHFLNALRRKKPAGHPGQQLGGQETLAFDTFGHPNGEHRGGHHNAQAAQQQVGVEHVTFAQPGKAGLHNPVEHPNR